MFYSFVYTIFFHSLFDFFCLLACSVSSVVGCRIRSAVEIMCARIGIGLYLSLIPVYTNSDDDEAEYTWGTKLSIKMRKSDTFSQFMCDDRRTCLFRMHKAQPMWSLVTFTLAMLLLHCMRPCNFRFLFFAFCMQYIGTSVQHFRSNFLRSYQALRFVVSIFDSHVK